MELPAWGKSFVSTLDNIVAISHIWLLITWNMASVTEELNLYLILI